VGRPGTDDSGAAAAGTAVVGPMLLLFFLVVQASLWFYGRTVLTSAAHHGLDAARVQEGTAADGEDMAGQFLDHIGGLDSYAVAVTRGEEEVSVTVDGSAITILPFLDPPHLSVVLSGPVERVVD
jgi:Flp pilus assembly protein TadG